jgi:hypothetical protein
MKSLTKLALGMAAFLAASVSASAQTTFDFADAGQRGADSANGSFNFFVDTLSVNVRAFTFDNGDVALPFQTATPNDGLFVDSVGTSQGLGLQNGLSEPFSPFASQVDGFANNEILLFSFNSSVELLNINFDAVGSNDDFTFITDATFGAGGIVGSSLFGADIPGSTIFNFTDPVANPQTSFGIAAIGGSDDFLVRSLTVSAVPEPATWLMMIIGFAFVGFVSQRRRRIAVA